jgi:hypothetical protein
VKEYKASQHQRKNNHSSKCDRAGRFQRGTRYLRDIVFTKNGNNFAQPWMLMRLKDLIAEYTSETPPGIAIYRSKSW